MNDLSTLNDQTMSSREIAALTGKEHYNVLKDIDRMIKDLEKSNLTFHCSSN